MVCLHLLIGLYNVTKTVHLLTIAKYWFIGDIGRIGAKRTIAAFWDISDDNDSDFTPEGSISLSTGWNNIQLPSSTGWNYIELDTSNL